MASPAAASVATPSPPRVSLNGKVALVTGGTGAIGGAVCDTLARQGCRIVVIDLDEDRCAAKAASLPGADAHTGDGQWHCGISINVSDPEQVDSGITRVESLMAVGGIDILINVAGILSNNKLFETSPDEWRRVHSVNYDAAFYLAKRTLPHMQRQQWGRVVNMSSWAWKSGGLTAGTAYSASKAAMVGLTFSLARQFASDGITCNAVAPCYVFSKMIMEQLTEDQRVQLLEKIPVGKFCTPDEVAHCVSFLTSPLSGFITGEVVDMNGGFQMD